MTIRLRVKELVDAKNAGNILEFALGIQIGYNTAYKLYKGRTVSIHLETVEKLCTYFGCTPNDLFEISKPESDSDKAVKSRRERKVVKKKDGVSD